MRLSSEVLISEDRIRQRVDAMAAAIAADTPEGSTLSVLGLMDGAFMFCADLVRRLFELEVPEIADGIIEIKRVVREPGYRTKMAVISQDPKIDCIGACVGVRGSRIKAVIDELRGERIDIIRWSDSLETLIMNGLKPATIHLDNIFPDIDSHSAVVLVDEDQQSFVSAEVPQAIRSIRRNVDVEDLALRCRFEAVHGQPAPGQRLGDTLARLIEGAQSAEPFDGEEHRRVSHAELTEEANVVLDEQSQVVDAVPHHGDSVDPKSECESGKTLGVDPDRRLMAPGNRPVRIVTGGRLLEEVLAELAG